MRLVLTEFLRLFWNPPPFPYTANYAISLLHVSAWKIYWSVKHITFSIIQICRWLAWSSMEVSSLSPSPVPPLAPHPLPSYGQKTTRRLLLMEPRSGSHAQLLTGQWQPSRMCWLWMMSLLTWLETIHVQWSMCLAGLRAKLFTWKVRCIVWHNEI